MGQHLKAFHFERPASAADAIRLFHASPDPVYLAGGTALIPGWRLGQLRQASTVISLNGCSSVAVHRSADRVIVGACAPVGHLRAHGPATDALGDAVAWFGTTQVLERATIGGNLGLASSASDLVPALAAMDARVRFESLDGAGEVPVAELIEKPGTLGLPNGSVLLDVVIPLRERSGVGSAYRRLTTPGGAILTAAVEVAVDGSGRVRRCRGALGAGLAVPVTVELLADGRDDDEVIAGLADALRAVADPIADLVATADYRREMIAVIVSRAFGASVERARTVR